ncbi:MAG: acetate--CoA ligase family protein, partial [Bacillota bacterium]
DDPQVDAVICIFAAYKVAGYDPVGAVLEEVVKEAARRREKPVAVWIFGASQEKAIARLDKCGVAAGFPNPERTARALAKLYHYLNEVRGKPFREPPVFQDVGRAKAAAVIRKAQKAGVRLLGGETMEILRAYGIKAAATHFASDKEAAVAVGGRLGYPLVMKIASSQVAHKSDVGGVRLNIQNEAELSLAYDELVAAVRANVPHARIDGVFLQKYHPGGVEVILGAKRDAEFGPVIVFGLGGIYTEVLKDVSFRLAPLAEEEAREMIGEIKSAGILAGARGTPAANIPALVETLMRLAQLVVDFPELAEIDVNPLAAGPEGVLALDARAVLEY